jgi:putative membrane protein
MLKNYLTLFVKGMGMGAANVIPGVSGGTIALITGIFEKLIDSIKSFNLKALRLIIKGEFKAFANHVNLDFLIAVFAGVAVSILSFAKLFEYLFIAYPVYIWSFFFGLILASVYFVGKTIEKWKASVIVSFILGTAIAIGITLMKQASENSSMIYLFICGIIAACSMILPGLSGSFVLILLGNYHLVMIEAVVGLKLQILLPVVLGAGIGLIAFSNFLSWLFKKFKNETIAILTGFILGSIGILWPWKTENYLTDASGNHILKHGKEVVESYTWVIPQNLDSEVIVAIAMMIIGIGVIWLTETLASKK